MNADVFKDDDGTDAFLLSVQFDRIKSLKLSRAVFKGHFSRIYKEIEQLLTNSQNVTLVNEKLKVLESAFVNYDQAHNAYTVERFQDSEKLHVASVAYEKKLRKKQELIERVRNWMHNAQIEKLSGIQLSYSVSQSGSSFVTKGNHRSSGSSISRLSVKIKVAKVEKAVAQLKLHQLRKKTELQQKRDAAQRKQELLDAENEAERATLKAQILEEKDDLKTLLFRHNVAKIDYPLRQKRGLHQVLYLTNHRHKLFQPKRRRFQRSHRMHVQL